MLLKLFSLLSFLRLRLGGARRRTARIGEVELRYFVLGPVTGEPWLLLHGLGATAMSWLPVVRALRGECRVIAPELSELGGTRAPGGSMTLELSADVCAQLIERETHGRAVTVAGISLGGWVATLLARGRPALVSRLLLIDTAGYRDLDWNRVRDLVDVDDMADVDRLYSALYVAPPLLLRCSRRGFLAAYRSPAVRHILETTDERHAFDDHDLAQIRVPTGVIWGEYDGLFPLSAGKAIAHALPGASLEILKNCGHAVHWECPDALVAAVERFRHSHPLANG